MYREGRELPVGQAGCCNYMWMSWLTGVMVKAFRKGLTNLDLFTLPTEDQVSQCCVHLHCTFLLRPMFHR